MYGFSTMVQRNWVRKMRGSEKWVGGPRGRGENNSMGNVMKEKMCVVQMLDFMGACKMGSLVKVVLRGNKK